MTIIEIALGVIIAQAVILVPVLLIKRSELLKRRRKREVFDCVEELREDISKVSERLKGLSAEVSNMRSREKIEWNVLQSYREKVHNIEKALRSKQNSERIKHEPVPTDKRNDQDRFADQFIKMVNLYVSEQETELGQAKAIQNIVEIMLSGSRQNREWWTKQVKTWAGVK